MTMSINVLLSIAFLLILSTCAVVALGMGTL